MNLTFGFLTNTPESFPSCPILPPLPSPTDPAALYPNLAYSCLKKQGMLDAKSITGSWHQKVEVSKEMLGVVSEIESAESRASADTSRAQPYAADSPPHGTPTKKLQA